MGSRRIAGGHPRWVWVVAAGVLALAATGRGGPAAALHGEFLGNDNLSDALLYQRVVDRVHRGEEYYRVLGEELPLRGYPTDSLFNWRTPAYAWLLGRLPSPGWARALFAAASATAIGLAFRLVDRAVGAPAACATAILLAGATAWWIEPNPVYFTELWAGLAIVLSILLLAEGFAAAGVGAGLFGLFLRELTLPFCLIAMLLAWRGGRRREALAWGIGLAIYGLAFAGHRAQVSARMAGPGRVLGFGWNRWLGLGGAPFLIATARMNALLAPAPPWLAALYLSLALAGLGVARGEALRLMRWTAWAYALLFLVIGQPFNYYWGWITAPLLAFGPPLFLDFAARWARGPLSRAGCGGRNPREEPPARPDLATPTRNRH